MYLVSMHILLWIWNAEKKQIIGRHKCSLLMLLGRQSQLQMMLCYFNILHYVRNDL